MSCLSNDLITAMGAVSGVVVQNSLTVETLSDGSGEVSKTFENITGLSEQNKTEIEIVSTSVAGISAQAEEVTASALALVGTARTHDEMVARFKLKS
jgi:methyl-accepting chemotaxis protein